MDRAFFKQRLYAGLLVLGAGFLLFRLVALWSEGLLLVWQPWVSVLWGIEGLIDLSCLILAIRWMIAGDPALARWPLRLGAAAAVWHALRVLIFVLGRVGPWIDADLRPEYRSAASMTWTWTGVYVAAILSILGVIGAVVIWRLIRKRSPSS